jgi:peptidoglycan/LPS O-acetylase OafA/YrhL
MTLMHSPAPNTHVLAGGENSQKEAAYVTSIDTLRAVAVIAVIVYHMHNAWLPGGFAGVDVFFVISGYVISRSMVSFANLGFPSFVGRFYSRRLRRIVPALMVCLLATTLFATAFIPRAWLSNLNTRTGQAAFWGTSNFTLMNSHDNYFAPRVEFNPFTHTWSLGVEEQFYVTFPTLFYFWLRFRNSESHWRKSSRYLLIFLFLISLCYSIYATQQTPVIAYYGLPSRFWELAAGALLFQFHHNGSRMGGRGLTTDKIQFALSTILMIGALYFSNEGGFPFPWAIPAVAGTIGAIDFVTTNSPVAARANSWLTWAPCVWIGKLSYSLYLWHWPVYVLARWTVGLEAWGIRLAAIGTTVLLSWASYVFVENPFRRGPLLRKVPPYAVIAGALCCVFVAWRFAHRVDHANRRLALSVTQKNSDEWYPDRESLDDGRIVGANCRAPELRFESLKDGEVTVYDHGNCNAAEPVRTMFVTGNSHALAYDPMLSRLARLEPYSVRILYNGCTMLNLATPMAKDSPECRRFFENVLADIEARLRPGDVVFLPSLRIQRFVDQWAPLSEAAGEKIFAKEASDAREAAQREADQVIERLTRHGAVVIFEAPKPIFRSPPFRCSDWFNRRNPVCVSGLTMSRDYLLQYRQPLLDEMDRLSQRHAHVYVWDPFDTLCPAETCEAVINGSPLFFDGDHLSAHGNRLLYPKFLEFLRSHSESDSEVHPTLPMALTSGVSKEFKRPQ